MQTEFNKLKQGDVLGESQFYTVVSLTSDSAHLKNDYGDVITVNKDYVESCIISANQYTEEKVVNKTDIASLFINHPNIVMTVSFQKQVKEVDVTAEILEAYQNSTPKEFETKLKKAVKKGLNGEERIMVGRHFGEINDLGRVNFVDMSLEKDSTKSYDSRFRQVDPRTISWLILKGIKYIVK